MNPSPILGQLWKTAPLPLIWIKPFLGKIKEGWPETTFRRENLKYWFSHRIVAPFHIEMRQAHIQQFNPWIPLCFNSVPNQVMQLLSIFNSTHIKTNERGRCWKSSLVSNVIYSLFDPISGTTLILCCGTNKKVLHQIPAMAKDAQHDNIQEFGWKGVRAHLEYD